MYGNYVCSRIGDFYTVPQLNMVCSLCSGFGPGSLGAPGGPWILPILFPAALPCEEPVAVQAAQEDKTNVN